MIIILDIETCKRRDLTERQLRRRRIEAKKTLRYRSDLTQAEAEDLAHGVHPFLNWICCICTIVADRDLNVVGHHQFTAAAESEERHMLEAFWDSVMEPVNMVRWVTFNGKAFDVPVLKLRTLVHGLRCRTDLFDQPNWRHRPHTDLKTIVPQSYGLADLCELLDVPSPKGVMDGSQVSHAVAEGRIEEVADYCMGDSAAAFRCYKKSKHLFA